jgi:hypothetical protein
MTHLYNFIYIYIYIKKRKKKKERKEEKQTGSNPKEILSSFINWSIYQYNQKKKEKHQCDDNF